MCDDYYDDDFMDDDIPIDVDCDEMDIKEVDISTDVDNSMEEEDSSSSGISLEDFTFWGGFLSLNLEEERMERRRRKKKERDNLDLEDGIKREDDF